MLSKGLEGGLGPGSVVLRGVKAARDCYSPMAIFPSCVWQSVFALCAAKWGTPSLALGTAHSAAGGPPALPGASPV